MSRYKCVKCRAVLESPASLVGQEDTCPVCGHVCVVPQPGTRILIRLAACAGGVAVVAVLGYVLWWPEGEEGRGTRQGGGERAGPSAETNVEPLRGKAGGAEDGRASEGVGLPVQERPDGTKIEALIVAINRLSRSAKENSNPDAWQLLRLQLYELDRATEGTASTHKETIARRDARQALGRAPLPKPRSEIAMGIIVWGDRNVIARGLEGTTQTFAPMREEYRYCSKWRVVRGAYLYKEDVRQLLARSRMMFQGIDKGGKFLGSVDLLDRADSAWLTALFRTIFSLTGGTGLRVFFHDGGQDVMVIAGLDIIGASSGDSGVSP